MAPHLPSSTLARFGWETHWIHVLRAPWSGYQLLSREIQGVPSGAPSQMAKNAEQRTIARGDGDSTHPKGEGMMSCPKGPSSLATQLCLPVETKTVPSSACCPGCSCISSSRAESCPLNHARSTRDGTVTRAFTESVNRRMWGPIIDSKRNANAVLGPPDLPHSQHTHVH